MSYIRYGSLGQIGVQRQKWLQEERNGDRCKERFREVCIYEKIRKGLEPIWREECFKKKFSQRWNVGRGLMRKN